MLGWETCTSRGVKNDDFSIFGDLGGDFYKETHEAKLFGMQIGSVLSGLEAGNVNNDSKKPVLGCKHMHEGVKNGDFFEFWRSRRRLL